AVKQRQARSALGLAARFGHRVSERLLDPVRLELPHHALARDAIAQPYRQAVALAAGEHRDAHREPARYFERRARDVTVLGLKRQLPFTRGRVDFVADPRVNTNAQPLAQGHQLRWRREHDLQLLDERSG